MNCQRIQESFVDYQSGTLPVPEAAKVRAHLKTCLTCQREWAGLQETLLKLERLPTPAPSPRLRTNFYAMLDEERRAADAPSPFALARSRIDAFFAALLPARPVLQFALTVFILAGGLYVGARYLQKPAPATAPVQVAIADPTTQQELADLRAKVESMGRLVTHSLQQQSANSRLQNILTRLDANQPDDRALGELLNTLALDPSTNVRLCALESLYAHSKNDAVRAGVLATLQRESSPLVQVAMIDFLVAAREKAAGPAFEELMRTATIDKAVRDAAQRGLAQL